MSLAAGITFNDTIVIARHDGESIRDWYCLLFHEVVHVVQFTNLGLDLFVSRYLRDLVAGVMDSYQNPLERQAYALQYRFESAPHVAYGVQNEACNSWLTRYSDD